MGVDLVAAGLIFSIALLLTGVIRAYAIKRSLLDHPNHRSSHTLPTPRGGGLAIVVVFLSSLLLWQQGLNGALCWAMIVGGSLIAAVGWLDDCRHVSVVLRLAVHVLAVAMGLYWLGGVPSSPLVGWLIPVGVLLTAMTGLWLVWLLNLFNFMDGIDGLAAMEASFVALAAALLLSGHGGWSHEAKMLIFFALSCLGFLVWNWPRAKVFMGDVGSGFLGYVLGMAAVVTVQAGTLILPAWLILLAAFWIDATITLLGRMVNGERWWAAHCSHAYQGAARRYGSHKKVTVAVLCLNCLWLLPLAYWANESPAIAWWLLLVAALPLSFLVLRERHLDAKGVA
ncbi:MAG: glycosyltransferase family 4 protein [Desulfobulbaceae bacterium]|nr:glycosyltransferase family 4 protein [Desulfobulbaceae bacterium]